jgi:hypothetical protein
MRLLGSGCSWAFLLVGVFFGVSVCVAADGVFGEACGVDDSVDGPCDLVIWSDENLLRDPGRMEDVDDLSRQCAWDIPCGTIEQDGSIAADLASRLQEECLLERIGHAGERAQEAWCGESPLQWGGLEGFVTSVVVAVDPLAQLEVPFLARSGDSAVQKLSSKSPEESFDLAAPPVVCRRVCAAR